MNSWSSWVATSLSCLVALAVLLPTHAHAVEGEWSLGAGGVMSSIPTEEAGIVGFGGSAFVRYKFTDSIGLSLGGMYSYHLPRPAIEEGADDEPAISVGIPRFGLYYVLDIIDLVPYFLVEATAYFGDEGFFRHEEERRWGMGAMVSLGVDYRRWRDWSIGLEIGYHAFIMDISEYPVFINVNLHFTWYSDTF